MDWLVSVRVGRPYHTTHPGIARSTTNSCVHSQRSATTTCHKSSCLDTFPLMMIMWVCQYTKILVYSVHDDVNTWVAGSDVDIANIAMTMYLFELIRGTRQISSIQKPSNGRRSPVKIHTSRTTRLLLVSMGIETVRLQSNNIFKHWYLFGKQKVTEEMINWIQSFSTNRKHKLFMFVQKLSMLLVEYSVEFTAVPFYLLSCIKSTCRLFADGCLLYHQNLLSNPTEWLMTEFA